MKNEDYNNGYRDAVRNFYHALGLEITIPLDEDVALGRIKLLKNKEAKLATVEDELVRERAYTFDLKDWLDGAIKEPVMAGVYWCIKDAVEKRIALLKEAADWMGNNDASPSVDWWKRYFQHVDTDVHMVLTEEGWEPGSILYDCASDDLPVIIDEVNAPEGKAFMRQDF